MFKWSRKQSRVPEGPPGRRAYVVGDVHGRLDLLDRLLDQIHEELRVDPAEQTTLVFVGDLIDRGPSSAQVVERLRTYAQPGVQPVFLAGNHEEVLLRILDGDGSLISSWLRFGGKQCLASYGLDPLLLTGRSEDESVRMVREVIPADHATFLRTFIDTCRFGDFLFVHAGLRPGVPLDSQRQSDLRWIRDAFLNDDRDHGFVVVHGHTIGKKVVERQNRIGIDTGAYSSGVLTALAVEGDRRWFLDTRAPVDAAVSATH